MAVISTIQCDVCGNTAHEPEPNAGWLGWGSIQGVAFNGVSNPSLCHECIAEIMNFIDGGMKNGMD